MVAIRLPRVLYFHRGVSASDADNKAMSALREQGAIVMPRNADQVAAAAFSPLEECDAVEGEVPQRYRDIGKGPLSGVNGDTLSRMSDLDRPHGPVASLDNELARAAKPPAVGSDKFTSQGADRPHGAFTAANGGFVAPVPGNAANVSGFGAERVENAGPGAPGEGNQGRHANPQGLPDAGVTLPATGAAADAQPITNAVAQGGGTAGFQPPAPVGSPAGDTADTGSKSRRSKGDNA